MLNNNTIVNLLDFGQQLFDLSREYVHQNAYLEYETGQVLVIQNQESAMYVLQQNSQNYVKRYDWIRQCLGISRLTEEMPRWAKLKNISQPYFNAFDQTRLLMMVQNVVAENKAYLCQPSMVAGQGVLNETAIRHVVLDIFSRTFFGFRIDDIDFDFSMITELLQIAMNYAFVYRGQLPQSVSKTQYLRLVQLRQALLKGFSQFRQRQFHQSQFMQDIVKADEDGLLVLEHEMVMLFSLGIETTVHALEWVLYTLAKYPQVQADLKQQMADNINLDASVDDYLAQQSVKTLIDRVLQQYPPTPCISREAQQIDSIHGFPIHKGQTVLISLLGMLHDPEWDFSQWTQQEQITSKQDKHMAFSQGKRMCGGKHYASTELIFLVLEFLRQFDIGLGQDTDLSITWNGQLNRYGGHPVHLTPCDWYDFMN